MKLTFLGAARTVTGSCYLIETEQSKVVIDCGMFQGSNMVRSFNHREFLFNPAELDAVILTHAHIDHSGLIPKLVKDGYKGNIYCTKVTRELATIMLPDSAHIQEFDAEIATRKNARMGKVAPAALYTVDDAFRALSHFKEVAFYERKSITPDICVRYKLAGHIMGAAMVEVFVREDGKETKILFSGDIGQNNQPITKDPDPITTADYILVESTYGDRKHPSYNKEEELAKIVNDTVARGGNLIIPAFAVGRTQNMLYYFQKLMNEGKISADIPIIIDSPLAVKATQITISNPQEFDTESSVIYKQQQNRLFAIKNLRLVESSQESKSLNALDVPSIILSASGMADAGRILHHLKHNLWRPECSVLFAGFQSQGSLGRLLVDGAKMVKIMGERISVKAKIYNMQGFSAHADHEQIIGLLKGLHNKPSGIFVVHGESDVAQIFADEIQRELGAAIYVPQYADIALIDGNSWKVRETDVAQAVPAIQELREELRLIEKNYFAYKMRLEQVVNRDDGKLKEVKRRLKKMRKYIDDNFSDL